MRRAAAKTDGEPDRRPAIGRTALAVVAAGCAVACAAQAVAHAAVDVTNGPIAFEEGPGPTADIGRANPDGTDRRSGLVAVGPTDRDPAFDATGTRLAFTSTRTSDEEIWRPASRGRRVHRVNAGYSGTALPRKLGIKPGHRVLILGAPEGFEEMTLGALPDGVRVARRAGGVADVIVSFHMARADLARRMPRLRERMEPAAGLWIAWPKRASGVSTDLTEDVVRELALANALVDNKVAAIDDTWSGLRLVIRLRDR